MKFLHKRSFSLCETELNAVDRYKFDNVQHSVNSRSRSDLHLEMALMLWRQCHDVSLYELSIGLLVSEKWS